MTQLPSTIKLDVLSPSLGFKLQGANVRDYAGFNLSHADVNGDGFDDLIVSADGYSGNGDRSGGTYVVFGGERVEGLLDLATLDEEQGFVIKGASLYDLSGRDSAGAGDINGDGFDDIIVAAYLRDVGGYNSGGAHVIYGKADGFGAYVDLSSTPDGFYEIIGEDSQDYAGEWVSSAGDINGDGFDDMLVSAPLNDSGGTDAGAAYVLFGSGTVTTAPVDLSALDPSVGFKIQGSAAGDLAGICVTGGGDLNGDGIDDFVVGAMYQDGAGVDAGAAYVIFGTTAGFPATLDLATLSSAQGYAIRGEAAGDTLGWSVALAGDINGDGVADLVIGAPHQGAGGVAAGAAYVVFGTTEGRTDINISELLQSGEAFKLQGGVGDWAGIAVSSAGDFNGDGFDDVLVGAWFDSTTATMAGASYLIFGGENLASKTIDLEALSSGDGIAIYGEAALDYLGHAVSAAGDLNGDGFDDIIVGAAANGAGGFRSGAAYVIYGTNDIGDDDSIIGGADPVLAGGAGNDSYLLRNAGYQVIEEAGDGYDTVYTTGSYSLAPGQEIEVLLAYDRAGNAAIDLVGNAYGQTIYGNMGTNFLNGGGGEDLLVGLGGDDVYFIADSSVRIREAAGGGFDTVYVTTSYTLAAGQEIEVLLPYEREADTALNLYGNAFDQTIYGNMGANFLNGRGGEDSLMGLGGNDSYMVDSANDHVIEMAGQGRDTVYATSSFTLAADSEIEVLLAYDRAGTAMLDFTGNSMGQAIYGTAGSNTLDGKGGSDTVYLMGGADKVLFSTMPGQANIDEIIGFGTDDKIGLSRDIFAFGAGQGLASGAFVVGTAAMAATATILYDASSGNLYYDSDGTGSAGAQAFAHLDGAPILTSDSFFLF